MSQFDLKCMVRKKNSKNLNKNSHVVPYCILCLNNQFCFDELSDKLKLGQTFSKYRIIRLEWFLGTTRRETTYEAWTIGDIVDKY